MPGVGRTFIPHLNVCIRTVVPSKGVALATGPRELADPDPLLGREAARPSEAEASRPSIASSSRRKRSAPSSTWQGCPVSTPVPPGPILSPSNGKPGAIVAGCRRKRSGSFLATPPGRCPTRRPDPGPGPAPTRRPAGDRPSGRGHGRPDRSGPSASSAAEGVRRARVVPGEIRSINPPERRRPGHRPKRHSDKRANSAECREGVGLWVYLLINRLSRRVAQ